MVAAVCTTVNGAGCRVVLGGTGVWHGLSAWRCVLAMATEGACVMSVVGGIDVVDCDGVTVSVVSVGAAAMNATAVMVVAVVVLIIVLSVGKSSLQLSWL